MQLKSGKRRWSSPPYEVGEADKNPMFLENKYLKIMILPELGGRIQRISRSAWFMRDRAERRKRESVLRKQRWEPWSPPA